MSESPLEPTDLPRGDSASRNSGPPAPEARPPTPTPAEPATSPFLDAAAPTDDSPTIISRAPRRTERPEDAFAVNLRGRQLAHFSLIEPIGVGGMAAVIRATDTQLDRPVALKILPPEMATDPENIRRFQQEARAAAKLDHENIARVFFCGEDQGLHFIAFEFVEGENLRTILERRGRIPIPEAINYMLQVAAGLAHASARGVVHRDIKPSNIIISPNGRAKLVDMGLARSLEPHGDGGLTQSGVTLGTFDYISPEQALEPRDADVRSDIYSLGCTFYHMLTGQPPVPEGTAARKLHHHQHVLPIDPRQLNPEIPDEVAAILAKMMAKEPRARYQRPEHLVQHLILAAQKLGSGADVSDGVLFVDAPLPGPPRARPLAVGLVAAAALVLLIIGLGSMSGPTTTPSSPDWLRLAEGNDHKVNRDSVEPPKLSNVDKNKGEEKEPLPPVQPEREIARTEERLSELLRQPVARVAVPTGTTIELKRKEGTTEPPGLVFHGQELTIEAQENGADRTRPTIRLAYDGLEPAEALWAALAVRGGKVTLKGLRFEINGASADIALAAIALLGADEAEIEDCEFIQTGLPNQPEQRKLTSIIVARELKRPLRCRGCYFRGGQDAVLLSTPVAVHSTSCAFGPHAALFRVRVPADRQQDRTELVLNGCSAMLDSGAVFQLDDGSVCRFRVEHCLFSRPESSTSPRPGSAVLIWQTGDKAGNIQYLEPKRNGYHNLRALWVRPGMRPVTALKKFQHDLNINDNFSVELTDSPWKSSDPFAELEKEPMAAFHVNEKLTELRQAAARDQVIGVGRCVWGETYPERLPPPEVVFRKSRIVDPQVSESDQGVYPNLGEALVGARPGDVIRIRHTGPLEVGQVRLEDAGINVTIRPHSGHQPILSLATTERDRNAALFRLHDAQLNLEDLQFRLLPRPVQAQREESQAVVKLVGVGFCQFKRCLVTLDKRRADDVKLAVVVLDDPVDAMKMGVAPPRQAPKIRLDQCFVRGQGDLVPVRVSRQFELEVEGSMLALSGSLLTIDANPKEIIDKPAQVSLKKVTAYLGEHLLWMRANDEGKGLVQTQFLSPSDCLFATDVGKSLVLLERINDDKQVQSCFMWSNAQHNAYSGFSPFVKLQPRPGEPDVPPWDKARWEAQTGEEKLFVNKVRFALPPVPERPVTKAKPADFKVKPDLDWQEHGDCGAPVELLPAPPDGD